MPDVFDYFLKSSPDVIRYECIEVTHPAWQKVYRYVRNAPEGLEVKHNKTDTATVSSDYYPFAVERSATRDDLDQSINLAVGDLGEDFPLEIDRLRASPTHSDIEPTLNYREYLSTDLTSPFDQVLEMAVTDYKPTKEGAGFVAKADEMNMNGTGYDYNTLDIPSLLGFV